MSDTREMIETWLEDSEDKPNWEELAKRVDAEIALHVASALREAASALEKAEYVAAVEIVRGLISTTGAALLAEREARVREAAAKEADQCLNAALDEAKIFCIGCAKKESIVVPPRSSIVGLAAVHSSGMICIPYTVSVLLKERIAELKAAKG